MAFNGIPLAELTCAHLRKLSEAETAESDIIDFKRQGYRTSEPDKWELLRDISAFANAQGGHILIGIEEKPGAEGSKTSRAGEVVGITDAASQVELLQNLVKDCIRPSLPGFKMQRVPVGDSTGPREVVVVEIPLSFDRPYMIQREGKRDFYRRDANGKHPMSIDEIRQAFEESQTVIQRTQEFIEKRSAEVERSTPQEAICMHVFCTPLLFKNVLFDLAKDGKIRSELLSSLRKRQEISALDTCLCWEPQRFLGGIENRHKDEASFRIYNGGHIEAWFAFPDWRNVKLIAELKGESGARYDEFFKTTAGCYLEMIHVVPAVRGFFEIAAEVFKQSAIALPAVAGLHFYHTGSQLWPLKYFRNSMDPYHELLNRRDRMYLSADSRLCIELENIPSTADSGPEVAESLLNLLAHAFHLEDAGVWKI